MKSANLARRIEPLEQPPGPGTPAGAAMRLEAQPDQPARIRARSRALRAIVIREQGFAPFRVR
jgi:hypothetical protein